MFFSYLKITFRNFRKNPLYTFINVFGLSLSIACFTVLFLLVQHETSYDKFNQKSEQIFRVIEYIEKSGVGEHSASVPFPIAAELHKTFPHEIEKTVRFFNYQAPSLSVSLDTLSFNEPHFFFVDSTVFEIFDFPLQLGNSKTALKSPNQVVISHKIATKYFGNKNPLNQVLLLQGNTPLTVVGVFSELPTASHFNFDFIASFSTLNNQYISKFYNTWRWNPCWTYILLQNQDTIQEDVNFIESQLNKFVKLHFGDDLKNTTKLLLQPLTDIHLYSALDYEIDTNGNIIYIYIFSVMAIFILLLAAINFMNLSTAKSSIRAKEILVRKMLGAAQYELSKQFIFESATLGSLGIFMAFVLIETIAPYLTDLSGKPLPANFVNGQTMVACILLTGTFLGLFAGAYPAYCFATYNPMDILRGKLELGYGSKWFRRTSVMIQFVMASLLLMATFVSNKQLDFMKNKRLGFDTEQILIIPIAQQYEIIEKFDEFKKQLLSNTSILSVTAMEEILGANRQTHRFTVENDTSEVFYPTLFVRYDFLKTFNIKLLAGRDFLENPNLEKQYRITDNTNNTIKQKNNEHNDEYQAVIINEEMVKHLGWGTPQNALGRNFKSTKGNEKVVGVVQNFHTTSLHNEVTPFVFDMPKDYEKLAYTKYLAIKFENNNVSNVKNYVAKIWHEYTQTPLDTFLLNDSLDKLYKKEQQLSKIASVFSMIGIFIACMGLFGLSSFVVENRYKEIGIRKALGATWVDLVLLLSKTYFIIAAFSLAIAGIIGYTLMYFWLKTFSYHIDFDVIVFLKTVLVVLAVTLFTISYHTIKAALQNPADVIRYK